MSYYWHYGVVYAGAVMASFLIPYIADYMGFVICSDLFIVDGF